MDARALIENIENYTVSGDSRSNQSSFRSPVQLRRRAFDSNFYFDEHTKRRNRTVGLSQSDQQHSTGSNKHKVRHITPPKVFQGIIFNVPDIRDDAPPVERDENSLHVGNDSPINNDSPLNLNQLDYEPWDKKYLHVNTQHSTRSNSVKVDSSAMVENIQRGDTPKDTNVTYWTTVAVKVAQTIVMNGGKLHHAEEAQLIILDCARDKSLSTRIDGSTVVASRISTALLELGANEYVVTKAVTMFLKCVSTPDISEIQRFGDSPLKSAVRTGVNSGASLIDTGCEVGSAFVSSVAEIVMAACTFAKHDKASSNYSSSSWHESSYESSSFRESTTAGYESKNKSRRSERRNRWTCAPSVQAGFYSFET
jgi:hypothetical protein